MEPGQWKENSSWVWKSKDKGQKLVLLSTVAVLPCASTCSLSANSSFPVTLKADSIQCLFSKHRSCFFFLFFLFRASLFKFPTCFHSSFSFSISPLSNSLYFPMDVICVTSMMWYYEGNSIRTLWFFFFFFFLAVFPVCKRSCLCIPSAATKAVKACCGGSLLGDTWKSSRGLLSFCLGPSALLSVPSLPAPLDCFCGSL